MIHETSAADYPTIHGYFGETSFQITDSVYKKLPILIIIKLGNFEFTTLHISKAGEFLAVAENLLKLSVTSRGVFGLPQSQVFQEFNNLHNAIIKAYHAFSPS